MTNYLRLGYDILYVGTEPLWWGIELTMPEIIGVVPNWTVGFCPWTDELNAVDTAALGLPDLDQDQVINEPTDTLLTLAQLKALLQISGSSDDADLTIIGPAVTSMIRQYLGRTINYGAFVTYLEDIAAPRVFLPETPIWAMPVMTTSDGSIPDVRIDGRSGRITGVGGARVSGGLITAVTVAGWPTVPKDLAMVYAQVCKGRLDAGVVSTGSAAAGAIESISAPDVGMVKFATGAQQSGSTAQFGELAPFTSTLDKYRVAGLWGCS